MKKSAFLLFALFLFLAFSCTQTIQSDNNQSDEIKKEQSIKAVCINNEKKGEDPSSPILIKECQYKNIKCRSEGYPDNKGRYSYVYEIMLEDKKVKNSDIFNHKINDLSVLLNSRILKDYKELYNSQDTKECFEGMDENPIFSIDDLGIEFDDNQIKFNVTFGLSGVCMSADGTSVSMSLEEIEPFLKK
mgnify:CR=1 FL=1